MDIYDLGNRYNLTVKKLRRMERDGVLRIGKSTAPFYWQKVRKEIGKGKMTPFSIALAYRFPDKLEEVMNLTPANRKVIAKHFMEVELPAKMAFTYPEKFAMPVLISGAIEKHSLLTGRFLDELKKVIPEKPVDYVYVAVRIFLMCETENSMNMAAQNMVRGLQSAREEPTMLGWSHREASLYGKYKFVYHKPNVQYDL
ncbi:MAG: hypothetical protein P4L87_07690 [Formivibrio sp.]|nr:hypothetical protein [Formivibrio sp.]